MPSAMPACYHGWRLRSSYRRASEVAAKSLRPYRRVSQASASMTLSFIGSRPAEHRSRSYSDPHTDDVRATMPAPRLLPPLVPAPSTLPPAIVLPTISAIAIPSVVRTRRSGAQSVTDTTAAARRSPVRRMASLPERFATAKTKRHRRIFRRRKKFGWAQIGRAPAPIDQAHCSAGYDSVMAAGVIKLEFILRRRPVPHGDPTLCAVTCRGASKIRTRMRAQRCTVRRCTKGVVRMIGIVKLALRRPYTFIVMALLIMIFGVGSACARRLTSSRASIFR